MSTKIFVHYAAVALALLPTAPAGTRAQQASHVLSAEALHRTLPTELQSPGSFQIDVHRAFRSAEEGRLLKIAEATYPPRDSVLAAIPRAHFKLGAAPDETYLWWSSSFDGVRIPYAITADAVQYYLDLTESFRRGDFSQSHGIRMDSSRFRYTATIEKRPEFQREGRSFRDVYVAELKLQWSDDCGSLCDLWIDKDRIVVLNPAGVVLAVFRDGNAPIVVS